MATLTSYSSIDGGLTGDSAAPARKGLFQRLFERLIEGRMAKAEAVLLQHNHLMPRDLEQQAGWRITERSEDSLPFIR